jgi:hypothetical protein
MSNEQIRFWLESLATIAGIVGLFAIALELMRSRKADTRAFYFHISEKFDALVEHRNILNQWDVPEFDELMLIPDEDERSMAFGQVINFWDMVTKAAHDSRADKNIALEQFGLSYYRFYSKWEFFFKRMKDIGGSTDLIGFRYFDWFAKEFLEKYSDDWEKLQKIDAYAEQVFDSQASQED